MKRVYCVLLPMLACSLMGFAQGDLKVTFHTSFAFSAGAAALPAGSYSLSDMGNGAAILNSTEGGRSAVIVLTRLGGIMQPASKASVSFVQRGGRYYLDSVNLRDGNLVRVNPVAVR